MSTCVVSGTLLDPSGNPISGISVSFNTQVPTVSAEPVSGSTSSAANGTWSLTLTQGISGKFTFLSRPTIGGKAVTYGFSANIPAAASAAFSSVVVNS